MLGTVNTGSNRRCLLETGFNRSGGRNSVRVEPSCRLRVRRRRRRHPEQINAIAKDRGSWIAFPNIVIPKSIEIDNIVRDRLADALYRVIEPGAHDVRLNAAFAREELEAQCPRCSASTDSYQHDDGSNLHSFHSGSLMIIITEEPGVSLPG